MIWLVFLSLLFYFLLVLAERSLIAVSPHDLEQWRMSDAPNAKRLLRIAGNVKPTLGTLVLARLFVKIGVVVVAVLYFRDYWSHLDWPTLMSQKGMAVPPTWLAECVVYGLLTLALSVVFWGIKRLDLSKAPPGRAANVLVRLAGLVTFCKKIFSPFIKKEKTQSFVAEGVQGNENTASFASHKRELEMLKSIVKFSDVTVKQVMQPRSKVIGVDAQMDFAALLNVVRESEFSRLPVFNEDLDNVTGIIFVKDLVPYLDKPTDFDWHGLVRQNVLSVPETNRISELLRELKAEKRHLAIVVDEYGSTAGIVTMEDILEEVIGDIRDEFDAENERNFQQLDANTFLFEGHTLLHDACRIMGIDAYTFDDACEDSDTLAGLVLELNGEIPAQGTEIDWEGFRLTVTAANNRRVEQVKIGLPMG